MVVVTFNHACAIAACLRAVLATVPPGTQVIAVDNASRDGTMDVVRRDFPSVEVIDAGANLGYGGGNNLGAARATGDVLVFLNPDALPQPGWLDALLCALCGAGGRALVTPLLRLARDPALIDTLGNDVHLSGITPSRKWGTPVAATSGSEVVAAVSGACFALPRALFWELGAFDARYFLYFEDTDLSLRARLAGVPCLAVADADVLHDHTPGFVPGKLRFLERNRYWTLLKLLEWRTLLALAPALALGEALAWGLALRSGPAHARAKALAWLDLLRWLPGLAAARREARCHRRIPDPALLRIHSTRLPFGQAAGGPLARLAEDAAAALFALARVFAWRLLSISSTSGVPDVPSETGTVR